MLVNLKAIAPKVSDSDLEKLSSDNPEAKFETDSEGHLIIMSPTGSNSGKFNLNLAAQIWLWNSQSNLGVAFDSSTGFKLSNNAVRSPDVTWVKLERWNELTAQQQDKYAPIDPDFVIELKSPSDDWQELQTKMTEYMNCDVKLGWLIDPEEKLVEIYRQEQNKEILNNPQTLSGEEVLPGLTVDLTEIF